ncbi:MAG: hypothetical protein ACYC9N_14485, partial [Thermoanaerobaculia bacterium]
RDVAHLSSRERKPSGIGASISLPLEPNANQLAFLRYSIQTAAMSGMLNRTIVGLMRDVREYAKAGAAFRVSKCDDRSSG